MIDQLPIVLTSVVIIILIVFLIVRRHKRSNNQPLVKIDEINSISNWGNNYFYHSDAIIDEKEKDEWILPEWLKARKEMIFPQSCVERFQEIGRGQFGAVFKGKLVQGQAVYV